MANTTISPNMNLPVPVVSTDPGPDWANNVNASLGIIDSHNHSAGQGVQISPNGLNINSDLTFINNNATTLRSARFNPQSATLSAGADVGCLYESGVDLYYNDGNGNQIRITQSGSVSGSSGTITGLPSGTASVSFSAGTYTFLAATLTPATMNVGPLVIGRQAASSYTVTIAPNSGQGANYNLTLPAAAPANNQTLISDGSGNLSWSTSAIGQIPLGAVIATFPNLTGAYSCSATTAADASGFVKCNGQTISDGSSPMNGQVVPNINNTVFLAGSTTAGSSGGAATQSLSSGNLPGHTHGAGSYATSVGVTGGTASLTGTTTFASSTHTHLFPHTHQWLHTATGITIFSYGRTTSSSTATSIGIADVSFLEKDSSSGTAGSGTGVLNQALTGNQEWYTAGAISAPSGSGATAATDTPSATGTVGISSTGASLTGSNSVTGTSASTGSGTSFSILPTYITTLYVMRIK